MLGVTKSQGSIGENLVVKSGQKLFIVRFKGTDDCASFTIFHYSIAVDGSVFLCIYHCKLDSLIIHINVSSRGMI